MNHAPITALHATLLLTFAGCITDTHPPSTDEAVLDHVEALGFSRNAAVFENHDVLVENDIVFDREALLSGTYERTDFDDDVIDKGYREPNIIAAKYRGNIRLAFSTKKAEAPSKTVRDGFIAAAKAWSAIPGSSIRIGTTNTGPAITVRVISDDAWPCPGTDACGRAPKNGRPGTDLYIRSRSTAGDCTTWSGSNLINMTRHELGHTLGFAHPKAAGSKRVATTHSCAHATEDACADDPGYATIMGAATIAAGCVVTPARLTRDDYLTCTAVYPAP